MSPRGRLILTVVISFLIALLFFFFFIRPRQTELAEVREEIETEEARTTQLQTELARLQDLQENAPRLQAELARIRELVPPSHEVPNFIFLVQEAANASGVGFLRIAPTLPVEPPEGASVAQVRTNLTAKGGYFAIQDFIRRLYALDRALRIDVLTLAGDAEAAVTRVDLDMQARVFFELPAVPATTTAASPSPAPEG